MQGLWRYSPINFNLCYCMKTSAYPLPTHMFWVKKFTTSTLYKNVDFNRCPILDLNLLGCYSASFLIAIQRFGTQKNVPKRCITLKDTAKQLRSFKQKKKLLLCFKYYTPLFLRPLTPHQRAYNDLSTFNYYQNISDLIPGSSSP